MRVAARGVATAGWLRRHPRVVASVVAAAVVTAGVVASVVAVLAHGEHRPTGASKALAPPAQAGRAESPGAGLAWHEPTTVATAGTPAQERYDRAFRSALAGRAGIGAAEDVSVPAPAIGGGWPALAVAETPEAWATEFVTGLLDIDYARRSRAALGAWVQAEEAPMLIPGLPASVADKVAYLSLLDPGVLADQPSPVPDPATWRANAAVGLRQSVSDLVVGTDPSWAAVVAAGWQPTDVRMAGKDVSGLLTLKRGPAKTVQRFSVVVYVGSARWHDGYGTESVTDWQVG
ncbi:MAG TPA: hypothetical protein VFA11_13225 [Acidimicrobiales bacterium]|nr:hypothetical protein [Acidimicrobiales bacterium]